ncbi:peptidyl-prolyl cis-trans isomerase, EpsD family [Sphingomonas sp. ABOLD]|uniref:EpsD family peptidyl-prolyl cis-trans isomerase n=1 Tax=Sphingomonas trueperi TaxID=53317 RepID=A0A7X5XWZ6_9SPHN|nr:MULTISPECIES: EpsD family peptidyl-prolyl cis-trans isomerase [Sphingomonas]NJB96627.1 EpsD family peptidyl-prolyl cis-trans isomerase [Sphingomonas trueperi]RSV40139.1 peptidyl-prolyl cis-trans isomerase, EpsD family [Sphingomonas sp. ABOLE]RSV46712.1 peptidyl-prolyl cis-trans isomerase, EpsD family [Sphingomonas sp. ABOLD]
MKKWFLVTAAAAAALAVSGCGSKDGKLDKGQVVASVDGDEITIFELNAEVQAAPTPAGTDRKLAEQLALQRIIERKILSKIAREQKLDKTPAFLIQQRRADELILTTMLRDKIAGGVAQPTEAEITQYQAAHPDRFAQRKIYSIDQIVFPAPSSADKFKQFAPLKTLDQLAAKLTADGTQFRRAPTQLDTAALPPEIAGKIAALPAAEMFILPTQQGLTANVITATTVQPVPADQAHALALNALRNERFSKAADAQLNERLKKARATVKYQPGYQAPPQMQGGTASPAASPAAQ